MNKRTMQMTLRTQRETTHAKKNETTNQLRHRRTWSRTEDADLIRFRNEDHPWEDIAETLGRTKAACYARFHGMRRAGVEEIDLSNDLSLSGTKWTKSQDKELVSMCRTGMPYEEMANALKRSTVAVQARASMLHATVLRSEMEPEPEESEPAEIPDEEALTLPESQPVPSNNWQFVTGALTMLAGMVAAKLLGVVA